MPVKSLLDLWFTIALLFLEFRTMEPTPKKRKLESKSFKEKIEILNYVGSHPNTKKDIAAHFKMKPQTLSDLIKNKEAILAKG